MKTSNPARSSAPAVGNDDAWTWVLMSLPSPISVSSWDLDSSNPCLEGKLHEKSPHSHCACPWELGAASPCSQSCGRGGSVWDPAHSKVPVDVTSPCHPLWAPALPCPALCLQHSPLGRSSHAGRSPRFQISLPSPLSIFSPTLMHPSPSPDLPKLLPSLIILPKHTQRLIFAAVCAFLWHPQSPWSSSSCSSPPQWVGRTNPVLPWLSFDSLPWNQLCVSSSPLPCGVAGFSKSWQPPSISYWLRAFFHVCVSLQCKWMTFIKTASGQDFTSLFSEKLVS